jgi:hypothetical protein
MSTLFTDGVDPSHALRSLCPLFTTDNAGWPESIGTGILLAIGEANFVVTTAHVFDLINGDVSNLCSFVRGELGQLRGSGSITPLPASGDRTHDRADTAFLRLLPDVAEGLAEQLNFWPITEVALGLEDAHDTHYTFSGYPNRDSGSRGRGLVRSNPLPITAGAYTDSDYKLVGLDQRTHVGIKLEGAPLKNESDIVRENPDFSRILNGLSGGAVWKNWYRRGIGEPVTPKLVGLCMELPPEYPKSFLGVRIALALEGIRTRFPELSAHIPFDPDFITVSKTISHPVEDL